MLVCVCVRLLKDWRGDLLEDEIVRVSGRRREHNDHGHEPVLEETRERSVERPVARPEAGERQDAFAAELLDNPALRENHRQDVAES
jgi:hypothetical protein